MATGTQRRNTATATTTSTSGSNDNKSSSSKKMYVYDLTGIGSRTPDEYRNNTTNSVPSKNKASSRSYWGHLKRLTTTTTTSGSKSSASTIHKKESGSISNAPAPAPADEEEVVKFVNQQPPRGPPPPGKLVDHRRYNQTGRRSVSQVEGYLTTSSSNIDSGKKLTNDPILLQSPADRRTTTTTKKIVYRHSQSMSHHHHKEVVEKSRTQAEGEDYRAAVHVVAGRTSVSHVENNVAVVGVRRLGGSMIVEKKKSWKLELEEECKVLQVKVLVTDMAGFMQLHAFRCARNTYDSLETFSAKQLAFNLKKEFDKVYGPAWHCIVGSSFGSFVTHATGCFLYFSLDKLYILLFRTKVRKATD